jgi:hypothetical protein
MPASKVPNGKILTLHERGWIPIAVREKTYFRLEDRLSNKREPWNSVVERVLDKLEAYEKAYPDFVFVDQVK